MLSKLNLKNAFKDSHSLQEVVFRKQRWVCLTAGWNLGCLNLFITQRQGSGAITESKLVNTYENLGQQCFTMLQTRAKIQTKNSKQPFV